MNYFGESPRPRHCQYLTPLYTQYHSNTGKHMTDAAPTDSTHTNAQKYRTAGTTHGQKEKTRKIIGTLQK